MRKRRIFQTLFCFSAVTILCWPSPAAADDVRAAVKKALPATVAVEWRAEGTKSEPNAKVSKGVIVGYANAPVGVRPTPDEISLSSGTAVSTDGLIVTVLAHSKPGAFSVTLNDGRTLPARLLVDDFRSGLKLLKIDADDLQPVQTGKDQGELGQQVVATYCTDLKDRAVAQGIVTSKSAATKGPINLFKTDVSVGPMSAGAPLVDGRGGLLGIVVAKQGRTGHERGEALAIPAEFVDMLLKERSGENSVVVHRAYLGVTLHEPDSPAVEELGVLVERVQPKSAAAAADIRVGDSIVKLDDEEATSPAEVIQAVGRHKAGEMLTVTIRRPNSQNKEQSPTEMQVKVTLGRSPATPAQASSHYSYLFRDNSGRQLTTLHPDLLYIADPEGRIHVVQPSQQAPNQNQPKGLQRAFVEAQKAYAKAQLSRRLQPRPVAPATIQVQRSDTAKKLDLLHREVASLRKQLDKLTEQLQRAHGSENDSENKEADKR